VVGEAPLIIIVSGVVERTATRYGTERARRYVALEAGHAAQNILLQAVSLGLGAVPVGAFDDAAVRRILPLADEELLCARSVGRPRGPRTLPAVSGTGARATGQVGRPCPPADRASRSAGSPTHLTPLGCAIRLELAQCK
jgi:hypothetical protein